MLQTRSGKDSSCAVKVAMDMLSEGLIDEKTAVLRVKPQQLDSLLHPQLDANAKKSSELLTKGLPASPGAAVGQIVFSAEDAHAWKENGKKVVLVRLETSPEDIQGMVASEGILTARWGMTSHAAVVARGMGKCCVSWAWDVIVDEESKTIQVNGKTLKEGDVISLDGSTGEVFLGAVNVVDPELSWDFWKLMELADKYRKLWVKTNADTPRDAATAKKFGAEGIGLCRTEHMFFAEDRIKAMREMILADTVEGREKALAKILPYQKNDFYVINEDYGIDFL